MFVLHHMHIPNEFFHKTFEFSVRICYINVHLVTYNTIPSPNLLKLLAVESFARQKWRWKNSCWSVLVRNSSKSVQIWKLTYIELTYFFYSPVMVLMMNSIMAKCCFNKDSGEYLFTDAKVCPKFYLHDCPTCRIIKEGVPVIIKDCVPHN